MGDGARLTHAQGAKRAAIVSWLSFRAWVGEAGFLPRVFLSLMSLLLLTTPLFKAGWKYGVGYTTLWIFLGLAKAWRELNPRNMRMLQRGYLNRKLRMYRLLQQMQFGEQTRHAVHRFQMEALELIAVFVRDHRLDFKGTKIFVNLLVEDGDDLVVIARDREHRKTGARYPKTERMTAWHTLRTGDVQVVGDLRVFDAEAARAKPYRSILSLPVRAGFDGTVVGVVSVDSSRAYHFDRFQADLAEGLQPYLALLAWTLVVDDPRFVLSPGLPMTTGSTPC